MKKIATMFTALMILIFSSEIIVQAANGPMGSITDQYGTHHLAYIDFLETDENGKIKYDESNYSPISKTVYSNETAQNELSGANYDKATNTLTITNLSAENMIMETNVMGDDFTLKVIGNCSIGQIRVFGDNYGGTLNIEGNGTLTVNSKKLHENAIALYAEWSKSALNFGKEVTVNLYASKDAFVVKGTSIATANQAVTFANGQNTAVSQSIFQTESTKWVTGFCVSDDTTSFKLRKVINKNDSSGIYGLVDASNPSTGEIKYRIYKLAYSETYNAYFSVTEEEIDAFTSEDALYEKYSYEGVTYLQNCYYYRSSFRLYQDKSGTEYVIDGDFGAAEDKVAMKLETLNGLEGCYLFTETETTINPADLEPVFVTTPQNGFYNYTLSGTSFQYKGGTHTHIWDNGTITTKPTATTTGIKTYTCTICSEKKTEIIPKTGTSSGDDTQNTVPAKGTKLTDTKSQSTYKVTKADSKTGTVTYTGTTNRKSKNIKVPSTVTINGITYKVTGIADNAFKGNKTVTKVTIPKNVTTIGKNAFNGCSKLKTITVGSNVTAIGANAFKGCSSLTSITLPSKTTTIGANAFKDCKKLKTLTIKSTKMTTKTLSKTAFYGLPKTATVKVPKSKVNSYKKLFRSKGLSSKVKLKAF